MDTLREELASMLHTIWLEWMHYVFRSSRRNNDGSMTIPSHKVWRWVRQINTPYAELTEKEKASDRELADRILTVLNKENDGKVTS